MGVKKPALGRLSFAVHLGPLSGALDVLFVGLSAVITFPWPEKPVDEAFRAAPAASMGTTTGAFVRRGFAVPGQESHVGQLAQGIADLDEATGVHGSTRPKAAR